MSEVKRFEYEWAGRPLVIEIGEVAKQANAYEFIMEKELESPEIDDIANEYENDLKNDLDYIRKTLRIQ